MGAVAITCGFLSTLLGGGWPLCLILMGSGLVVLFFVVRLVGRPTEVTAEG